MRQGVLLPLLLLVAGLISANLYAQDILESDSRFQSPDENVIITPKPQYSDLVVQDLFDKIKIGFTCSHNENSLKNYLFSTEDIETYVNNFEKNSSAEKAVGRSAAVNRIEGTVDMARMAIEEVGTAEQVTLVSYEAFYSDEDQLYNCIRYVVEAFDEDGDPHNLELLLVEMGNEFKLIGINK